MGGVAERRKGRGKCEGSQPGWVLRWGLREAGPPVALPLAGPQGPPHGCPDSARTAGSGPAPGPPAAHSASGRQLPAPRFPHPHRTSCGGPRPDPGLPAAPASLGGPAAHVASPGSALSASALGPTPLPIRSSRSSWNMDQPRHSHARSLMFSAGSPGPTGWALGRSEPRRSLCPLPAWFAQLCAPAVSPACTRPLSTTFPTLPPMMPSPGSLPPLAQPSSPGGTPCS